MHNLINGTSLNNINVELFHIHHLRRQSARWKALPTSNRRVSIKWI